MPSKLACSFKKKVCKPFCLLNKTQNPIYCHILGQFYIEKHFKNLLLLAMNTKPEIHLKIFRQLLKVQTLQVGLGLQP